MPNNLFKKTLVSVPTTGSVTHETMNSLVSFLTHSRNWAVFFTTDSCEITSARNDAVQRMFEKDCDGVLFIDSDQSFHKDALDLLIETHKDIVGCPIVRKTPPYYPNIGKWNEETKEYVVYENYPKNYLFQVDYIGMGFTYIRRAVFEKLEKPYFDWDWHISEKHKKGEKRIGEDTYFCINAKKAGFKVWCNPMIEIGHIGTFNYLPQIYTNYAQLLKEREENGKGKETSKQEQGELSKDATGTAGEDRAETHA